MKRFLLLLFCMALTCAALAVETQKKPVDEVFTEPNTGLVFPGQIGCFIKKQVRLNANKVIGTSVRYMNQNNTTADIFISATKEDAAMLDEKAFAKECANAEKQLLSLEAGAVQLKPGIEVPKGVFYRRYRFTTGDFHLNTHLMMFQYKNMMVKCRVSYPSKSTSEYDDVCLFEKQVLQLAGIVVESAKKN